MWQIRPFIRAINKLATGFKFLAFPPYTKILKKILTNFQMKTFVIPAF